MSLRVLSSRRLRSSDEVEVVVHELGGEGPLLLLAHATGFHGLVYAPMVEELKDFRCVAVDLRGHGDATEPSGLDFSWQGFADDLLTIVEWLSPAQPIAAFGHSMGAASLLMVEQQRPGSFSALYAYEPVAAPTVGSAGARQVELVTATRKRRAQFPSYEAAIAHYGRKSPFDSFDQRALEAYVRHGFRAGDDGAVEIKCKPESEAAVFEMSHRHRTYDRLTDIRCPVTIARGSHREPGPGEWADSIASRIPGAHLETFQGLGHLGPFQHPQEVGRRLRRFLLDTL